MAATCVLFKDHFQCPICLEVFSAPVTTPCGHTFCKHCIEEIWNHTLQCPVCMEVFSSRPQMKINTVLAEMISEFRSNSPVKQAAGPALEEGDVPCDVCWEPRMKAVKSCLLCLASYCPKHLQPHVNNPCLKRHQLIEAGPNLEKRICHEHNAPLVMFCRMESKPICLQCFSDQHKAHNAVPLKVQCEANEKKLNEIIQMRREKIEEIQSSLELSQKNADKEMQDGVKVFNALMDCVQRSLNMFKDYIQENQKNTVREALDHVKNITKEIEELEQKRAEMSSSGDHLRVLQKFSSVRHGVDDWAAVSVSAEYSGVLTDSVAELQNGAFSDECRKVFQAKLSHLKQSTVNLTFDPQTAHKDLQVSKDMKAVKALDAPNSSWFFGTRFQSAPYVMSKQVFSPGQFYFEVVVKHKIMWAVGVAIESAWTQTFQSYISSQMWLMTWDNEEYYPAKVGNNTVILKSTPEKVGVFVDYEECVVSFYDAETALFIGSIQNCGFRGNIRPIFSPGGSMNGKNCESLKLEVEDFGGFRFS